MNKIMCNKGRWENGKAEKESSNAKSPIFID
jgi:hypothetical protein